MFQTIRKLAGLALALSASLVLTGCIFTPGQFGSQLDVNRDGTFAYSYEGEIVFLLLSDAMRDFGGPAGGAFTPYCWKEATGQERDCTPAEEAEQRAAWDSNAETRSATQESQAENMMAMMGFDPRDPEAGNEIAHRLQRQEGWESVTYRGNGVFDVRYAISGRLDHDFTFPHMEGMAQVQPFVSVYRRDDGQVRIEAPGFAAAQNNGMPGGGLGLLSMAALGRAGVQGDGEEDDSPQLNFANGTFVIATDGQILANNTDEGPEAISDSRRNLSWVVNARSEVAPSALIDLR